MSFRFQPLDIPEVLLIESDKYVDERGFFAETFRAEEFEQHGLPKFVQENCSLSMGGVVRGLHFQSLPRAQAKLVQCLSGSIFDVAVDLRQGSPTYTKHIAVELKSPNNMLYVPVGFAHGFMALQDYTVVSYKVSDYYSKEHDNCIKWNDRELGINWPVPKNGWRLSEKDSRAPTISNYKVNFKY